MCVRGRVCVCEGERESVCGRERKSEREREEGKVGAERGECVREG